MGRRSRGQRLEIGQGSEIGVNRQVIGGVVFVVRGRAKDRVEIQHRDAQLVEIAGVDLLGDACQVTAVEVLAVHAGAGRAARVADGRVPVRCAGAHHRPARLVVEETPRSRVVGQVAVPEAVGEDLVDDAALEPFGDAEGRVVDGKLVGIVIGRGLVRFRRPVAAAVEFGIVVTVESRRGPVCGFEHVIKDVGIRPDGQVVLPEGHTAQGGVAGVAVEGQIGNGLGIGAVIPQPDSREAGHVVHAGAEAQADGRAGRHRAGGVAVSGGKRIVKKAVVVNIIVALRGAITGAAGGIHHQFAVPGSLPIFGAIGGVCAIGSEFIQADRRCDSSFVFIVIANIRVVSHWRVGRRPPRPAKIGHGRPRQSAGNVCALPRIIGYAILPNLHVHVETAANRDGAGRAASRPHIPNPAQR